LLNGLDLFSGIGGISLGLKKFVRPIAYCENDRYAQGVLLSRMGSGDLPNAPIWDDITTLGREQIAELPTIDIIYGGFPCQDISCAGNRIGLGGKRSGLFFEIVRLAEIIKPKFIFLENVPAIRNMGLNTIGEELARLRYDCRWGVISAYDVGAPHLRKRWFLLAYAKGQRCGEAGQFRRDEPEERITRAGETIPNPDSEGLEGPKYECSAALDAKTGQSMLLDSRGQPDWPIEPDVGRVVNGLPRRVDRIKCLGNAVVPKQVEEAFQILIGEKNGNCTF